MITLSREQLEERLAALHRASLELVQDISLESLLERIAIIACEQVGARYAAVGVLNENGELEQFIPIGMTPAEIKKMAHSPRGSGLIGALMNTRQTIRLADIADDPRSAGFPPHHPEMKSFLGVPIRLGESQLGQIYLTEKNNDTEFSRDDEVVLETLAAYAAVAISNARLYQELRQRDRALTRRTNDLTLLNDLASKLTSETRKAPSCTWWRIATMAWVVSGTAIRLRSDRAWLAQPPRPVCCRPFAWKKRTTSICARQY
jgi:two-component system sensor histidine kinase DevS